MIISLLLYGMFDNEQFETAILLFVVVGKCNL
jgi:hypothetical protein